MPKKLESEKNQASLIGKGNVAKTEHQYFVGFKKLIEENPIYKDMVLIEIEPCQAEAMEVIGMAEHFNGVVERAESLNKENSELQ